MRVEISKNPAAARESEQRRAMIESQRWQRHASLGLLFATVIAVLSGITLFAGLN